MSVVQKQTQRNRSDDKQIKVFGSLSEYSSTSVCCHLEQASKCCNAMQGNIHEQSGWRIMKFKSELKDVLSFLCFVK